MKKVVFLAIAMIAFAGSAFASNEVIIEALRKTNDKPENETIACKWRTVTTYKDGSKIYGPWEYGRCLSKDGVLTPMKDIQKQFDEAFIGIL